MKITIQYKREEEGLVMAEVPALPGVMAYARTKAEARSAVVSLAQMVITDQAERKHAGLNARVR
ncbi:MAG: type II toxin-antitoxin system HicB family antitoxin [Janthinobacterium lividum]